MPQRTQQRREKQKEDFKTETDKTKETRFFLGRKNSEHETHIEAELDFFLFFSILFPIKCLMLEL